MGFDGIEISKYYNPSLTTMVQPSEQMVESCIELLMKQIEGEEESEHVVFEASLLERDSVKEI